VSLSIIPLKPKNPNGPLKVIVLGRISTAHQDKESITASFRFSEEYLRRNYNGPLEIQCLGEQASGMRVDRATIVEAEELIATEEWDLVLSEDLSRIYRNPRHQWAFVQDAYDHHTRVICIADNLDTADENWQVMMHAAGFRHGLVISDTQRRVGTKATHAFHEGGMVQKVRYGYRKLTKEEAATGQFGRPGLRITRRSECTPILQEIKARVLRGESYTVVAEWLQESGVQLGAYVKCGRWTGRVVETLLRDPILSGTRTFRDYVSEQIFKTGRHRSHRNPDSPEMEQYPELAHFTPEEHAELLVAMDARKNGREYLQGRGHPLTGQLRARSLWPGQHARCAICGGLMYRFGNCLKCENSRLSSATPCWNHVQVDFAMLSAKVLAWLCEVLAEHPRCRTQVAEATWQELSRSRRRQFKDVEELEKGIARLQREADNLAAAIAQGGELEALLHRSVAVDQDLKKARNEKAQALQRVQSTEDFVTFEDVVARLEPALIRVAGTSRDFAQLLRRRIPTFTIHPVQALDCAQIRPRARLTVRLEPSEEGPPQEISATLDLFEPAVHIKYLAACLAMKEAQPKATLDEIAAALGINRMTVKRALATARLMQQGGVTEPFVEINQKPEKASRWKKRRPRRCS
jgi:site-specific DNA recombinase